MNKKLNLSRTLQLIWKSSHKWALVNVVLLLVQAIIPLISLYLMKLIIDTITSAAQVTDKTPIFRNLLLLVGITVIVSLLGVFATGVAKIVNNTQAELVSDYVYDLLHTKSIEVDLEYYDNSEYYDALHRAQSQAVYRPVNIMLELIATLQHGISLLAIFALLFTLHWGITLILLGAAIPGILVRLRFADRQYRWMYKNTSAERKANYLSQLLTLDSHAKEIRLFGLGNYFQEKFNVLRAQLRQEKLAIVTRRSIQESIVQAGSTIAVFGAFIFIAYRTIKGEITIGELIMYNQAFQRGQDSLERMMQNLSMLYENNLFLSNLYKFLDLKAKVTQPAKALTIPKPMIKGIVFNHVSFNYANSSREALKDINLTIRPGEIVALVGENGSGKTTLVKLLCRLYDPCEGSITMDDRDYRNFDIVDLRREISVIFQDYAKYHLTALENIWFGDINLDSSDEKIIKAAYRSGAEEVINKLPQSYQSVLGKWFESGEELSIGQWQKIALARAFLRNSQVIVLDEPTSALDPKAEYEVFLKFRELLQNQAAVLISHRLSTVKMADRICVLSKGRIVERGTHTELMQIGGTYAQMFEKQAQQYRV